MKKPKTPSSKPKSPTKPSLLYRLFTNTMVLATVVVLISCGFEAFFWHGKLIWLRFSDTAGERGARSEATSLQQQC